MNKNLHRIIFNACRGIRMAVAETASAQGKRASGEANSVANSAAALASIATAAIKPIALCAALWGLAPWVLAQIVVDRNAPGNQQPTLMQTANGLPQVNIQTPSAAGVSRNVYTQFDVQNQGVILNNSTANVQTQLGGYVQNNPWLTGGSARVILNEVNSNNASQIRGYVEVAGQRAEVIIANPAGIAVSGGGFLNASAVTLTTGTPVMNGGNLESYRVRGGNISIGGTGLDTGTADYTNILARAVQVNAGIWAKDLKIFTGVNQVDASNAANPAVTGSAGPATDATPSYAIDVAQLGGMYAGKIFLVGTEAGLGVRNAGTLAATAGDLSISNNGWLSNSGTVHASGDTRITAQGDIANTGSGFIAAQGNTTLEAQGTMGTRGSQITQDATASLMAGVDSQGNVGASGNLQATAADSMGVQGQLASAGNTTLSATQIDLHSATLSAHDATLTASTGGINASQATIATSGTLSANAAQTLRTDGATVSADHLKLQAHDISNVAGQLLQTGAADMAVALAGNLDNTDGTIASNATNLKLGAATLTNLRGHIQHAGTGTLQVDVTDWQGTSGQLLSNGTLNLNATHVTVDQGTTAAADVSIQASSVSNQSGLIVGSNSLHITADTVDNTSARLHSDADLTLDLAQSLTNTDGLITAGQLTVRDTAAISDPSAARALAVTNTRGTLLASQTLSVSAASLDSSGSLLSQGDLTLDVQGNANNSGSILASNKATLAVGGTLTHSGTLQAGSTVDVTAQNLDAAATAEISGATTLLKVSGTLNNQGLIDSSTAAGTGETRIDAGSLHNTGAGRIYGDVVSIAATMLTNDAQTANGVTTAATIAARQQLDLGVGTLNNLQGASILSLGDMAIGGTLDANRHASGAATTVTNSASTIEAQGALTIQSGAINNLNPDIEWTNDVGTVSGTGTLYFTSSGTFDSANGAVVTTNGSLVGMSHGGYSYYQVVDYVPEMTCAGKNMDICTPTGNMIAEYDYGQGAVQPSPGAGAITFSGFANYTQTDHHAVVTKSTPGRIASGGDMNLNVSGTLLNDQSEIVAGGALNIVAASVDNNARTITVNNVRAGTAYAWSQYDEGCGDNFKGCTYNYQAYKPSDYTSYIPHTETLDLHVTRDHANGAVTSRTVAATTAQTVGAASGPATSSVSNVAGRSPAYSVPTSSLYQINTSPTAHYLVATDPRFTNYKNWLSSDYISAQIAMDPTVTQKRLGDGYYEQRLINEQVAELTGRRFLDNYTSDQQQYQALMDAGITYAKDYQLQEGVALTAEQIARLTSDIVWLQQETVTLADGSTTQALVPHLYLVPQAGDLAPNGQLFAGATLSGNTVNIQTSGDTANSGSILGRQLVQINADNIANLNGTIKGQNVVLQAAQDISNTGGSVIAQDNLIAQAGNNITVASTTSSGQGGGGNYTATQTGVDRVAGLYVTDSNGTLLASAGNDMNLIAAQINSAGNATLAAGNNLNLDTVKTSQTNNFGENSAEHHLMTSQSQDVGSSLTAAGNVTLSAGSTLSATAANVHAGGDLNLNAQNIALLAGQTTSTLDFATKSSTGGLVDTTTSTQTKASAAQAQASTLSGNNINVVAESQLVSVATQFQGNDTIHVEGKDSSAFYSATNVQQSETTTHSTSNFAGINLSDKTATDQLLKTTSVATSLTSTQAIDIVVGNRTELQGTNVQAQQIAFTKTDPNAQGELILSGSIDTTQTSHTEKNETAGVWQEMKGKGSTTQTLNQTQLNGNVTFDAALKISVQIPDTKGGQEIKTQLNTLAAALGGTDASSNVQSSGQAGNTTSKPGLDYLNQLAANPNVQWDKVALAHENWSYDQSGLTPAGAALVSIAVAAATGGAAAGWTSGLTGVATVDTALAAGLTSLASQAAVALANNGGDIGKTLAQLGSEQSVKGLLTAMVTAGALNGLGLSTTQVPGDFTGNLLNNLKSNLASSAIDAAVNGKPFDENTLANSLKSSLITAGMAYGANAIGNARVDGDPLQGVASTLNDFTSKIAHAVLGCIGGAATVGNGSGCAPGAVGAVVGEITAEYAKDSKMSDTDAVALAKVFAGVSGVLTGGGGDNAQAVNVAATTGANAAENNYLKHAERLLLKKAQMECFADATSSACETVTALKLKDELSNKLLANAAASCKGSECNDVSNFIQQEIRTLGCTAPSACPDYDTLQKFWSVAQAKAQGLEPVYPEEWLFDAKALLDLGKLGVRVLSGARSSATSSLEALGQLGRADANLIGDANFYKDGSNPAQWTIGKPKDGDLNLATHWEKHKAEFPSLQSQNDYYRATQDFVTNPPAGTLIKITDKGEVLLYDPASNIFAIKSSNGLPATMFKPQDKLNYFQRQRGVQQ